MRYDPNTKSPADRLAALVVERDRQCADDFLERFERMLADPFGVPVQEGDFVVQFLLQLLHGQGQSLLAAGILKPLVQQVYQQKLRDIDAALQRKDSVLAQPNLLDLPGVRFLRSSHVVSPADEVA